MLMKKNILFINLPEGAPLPELAVLHMVSWKASMRLFQSRKQALDYIKETGEPDGAVPKKDRESAEGDLEQPDFLMVTNLPDIGVVFAASERRTKVSGG